MRNAASKVMWVGRATVFMVGLSVMLALVLGAATTALGATGATFILGKANSAESPTSLVSTLSKATQSALSVTNKSGGPALTLGVLSGKAPMKVSATAGTATNLSADKLDGKDSSEFLGKTEKAADAAHADSADHATTAESATSANSAGDANTLDGQDSAAFLGATQKAADSELLDGKNSSDFAAAYKRTVVVSPVGTDTQNGQALLDALNGITDASATKPYLIYIEPGTYDLGTRSLQMKQHVDMEGAGELKTLIRSQIDNPTCTEGNATVRAADNAELRFLTVRNTGSTGACNIAIYSGDASTRLTHVTGEATGVGGGFRIGVVIKDGSLTMTNVTATASGGEANFGVHVRSNAILTIQQSKLNGNTNSLLQQSSGTVKLALTQLEGSVRKTHGTLQCFNNYDQNMAPVTCP